VDGEGLEEEDGVRGHAEVWMRLRVPLESVEMMTMMTCFGSGGKESKENQESKESNGK
jgi:hypothetical protein